MHSRILVYLDVVARCGSIRKAGEQLNVASTAINRQILALEEQLGTQIFQRLPRKLVLTAAGEILITHARETLKGMSQTRRLIDEMRGLQRGELTVAAMAGPTTSILPGALLDLRRTHRYLKVHVKTLGQPELTQAVQDGEADLGIGFDLPRESGVTVLASRAVSLGAVLSPDHPLCAQESVNVGDCAAYPLVVGDATMAIRPHLDAFFARLNMRLSPAVETNSIDLMRVMAMEGEAITFLTPLDVMQEVRDKRLRFLPLREAATWPQHLAIVAHTRNTNPMLKLLVDRIEAMIATL